MKRPFAFRIAVSSAIVSIGLLLSAWAQPGFAQEKNILQDVISRGVLRIATVPGNPPYSSLDPSNQPVGYDVEIGKRIAAALKVKPEFTMVDGPGRITALQTGRVDLSIADFTNTVERSTAVAFTSPYLIIGSVFMVRADSDLKTIEDLNSPDRKIGVVRGGTTEATAKRVAPNAQIVRFDNVLDVFLALKAGQVDAHLQDSLKNATFLADSKGTMRNLPGNYSYEEIAVGVPTGDFDWWRVIDTWVRQFNHSGENDALFKEYFGYPKPKFD